MNDLFDTSTEEEERDDEWTDMGMPSVEPPKRAMPPALIDALNLLKHDIILLHFAWNDFSTLFRSKESRETLRDTAGGFFRLMERIYWQFFVIEISKLLDNADGPTIKGVKRENLTLGRLVLENYVDDPDLRDELDRILDQCKTEIETVKIHRNKRHAHNDLPTRRGVDSLDPISFDSIDKSLSLVRKFMNAIDGYYNKEETMYSAGIDPEGAELLLFRLQNSLRWEEQRKKERQWHTGTG